MQRIHIVGAAGSGKTTLARQLSTRLAAPWYELDVVGYENGAGRKRTLAERQVDLRRITCQRRWVTEGIFLWWTQEIFERADTIVWLDLPWWITQTRIVTRHVQADLAGDNRHPGLYKLLKFVLHCQRFYIERTPRPPESPNADGPIARVTIEAYLQNYMDKVVHCRRPADVAALLERVSIRTSSAGEADMGNANIGDTKTEG